MSVTKYMEKLLKGGKIYFGSWIQRFLSNVGWLHFFGPEAK
jgi:hypothetical protein